MIEIVMLNQKGLPWNSGFGELFLVFLLLSQLWCCDVIAVRIELSAKTKDVLNKVSSAL